MNLENRVLYGNAKHYPRVNLMFSANDCQPEPQAGNQLSIFDDSILLSWNHETHTRTLLLQLKPSVSLDPGYFNADVELFVVSGEIRIGEWHLNKHGYSYIPKGVNVGGIEALSAATLLWMENGPEAASFTSGASLPDADWNYFIPPFDAKVLPWEAAETVQFMTSRKKYLRKAPNGGGTWLLTVLPHYYADGGMIQSYNEEAYILSGWIQIGDRILKSHHYSYAPSFTTVGRHVTDEGVLCFVRVDRDLTVPGRVITYPHPLYADHLGG